MPVAGLSGGPIFLEELISAPDNALIRQSLRARQAVTVTNGDGFGVAWYDARPEPGLFRDILPAWNDANLLHLARQVKSRLFLAHVRASTGTATSRSNCHPFAVGRWTFMHNGQIGGYQQIRRKLEREINDSLFASRFGSTDSELIFLMLLQNGFVTSPQSSIAATIGQIEAVMADHNVDEPLRFTACLSDGDTLIAWRYANDDKPPSLFYHQRKEGTVIASEPLDDLDETWTSLKPGEIVMAGAETAFSRIAG